MKLSSKILQVMGIVAGTFSGANAFAWSLPDLTSLPRPILATELEAARLRATSTPTYDFAGIVALSNCSGSLVRFASSQEGDQALVLTNGHCVGFLDPGTVKIGESSNKNFGLLRSDTSQAGKLHATKLVYATMTKTDIGLYQVKETYADIKSKYNIIPFTIADSRPAVGSAIQVISGYWRRGYACNIEAEVHQLKEAKWTMEQSLRYSRPGCDTIGGTSGSPVVDAEAHTVVAINNTGNEDGERCTMNNPCEVDANGEVSFKKGFSYAQQTFWMTQCLNSAGTLDVSVPGCELPRPSR